ncbi:MAG: hypothetical protein WBV53_12870 [Solirubrobacterales bacterium]
MAYTGIECGGTWKLDVRLDSKPPIYEFTEQISEGAGGACKGTGLVRVERKMSDDSRLRYEFSGGGVRSRGSLHRTDAAALAPVFEQAGVEPPG